MSSLFNDYHQVKIAPTAALSPRCSIVGDVTVGERVTVFAGVQIRGDEAPITIGDDTNLQENVVLHVSRDKPLRIGNHVTVGHGAVVHGCTVEDNVLVGMGAILLDGCHIGRDSLVGAGALVTQGKEFPPNSMILGAPARALRELSDEEVQQLVTSSADDYVKVAQAMVDDGVLVRPTGDETIWE